jgi:ribosome-associated toxin RatA of RatAB toxin-antitoxin module
MRFREELSLTADEDAVWKRVSDVTSIPSYWHGTKSLEIIGTRGSEISAQVQFAFGGRGIATINVDEPNRTLIIDYTSGPFTGIQKVSVGGGVISAVWDVRFRGAYRLLSRWNEGHFRSGTKNALLRLVSGQTETV